MDMKDSVQVGEKLPVHATQTPLYKKLAEALEACEKGDLDEYTSQRLFQILGAREEIVDWESQKGKRIDFSTLSKRCSDFLKKHNITTRYGLRRYSKESMQRDLRCWLGTTASIAHELYKNCGVHMWDWDYQDGNISDDVPVDRFLESKALAAVLHKVWVSSRGQMKVYSCRELEERIHAYTRATTKNEKHPNSLYAVLRKEIKRRNLHLACKAATQ